MPWGVGGRGICLRAGRAPPWRLDRGLEAKRLPAQPGRGDWACSFFSGPQRTHCPKQHARLFTAFSQLCWDQQPASSNSSGSEASKERCSPVGTKVTQVEGTKRPETPGQDQVHAGSEHPSDLSGARSLCVEKPLTQLSVHETSRDLRHSLGFHTAELRSLNFIRLFHPDAGPLGGCPPAVVPALRLS